MNDPFTDDFRLAPYWWDETKPVHRDDPNVPSHADIVIIGGGYAGLNAAIELAQAGCAVTVVDKGTIGAGASSRAAGFTSGRAGISKQINLEATVGEKRSRAILEEADTAYDQLQTFITSNNIECDYQHCGRFVGAHSARAYDRIATKMAEYKQDSGAGQSIAPEFEMIPQSAQSAFVQSEYFKGGMFTPNAGSINPAKYHAGLLRLADGLGVQCCSDTRVVSIVNQADNKHIHTSRGIITARDVIIATGGYTDRALPWFRRRVIPISSTIIATEPIGRDRVAALLPQQCPVIDTKRVISFARPSPDGTRILFGGRAKFTPTGEVQSARLLYKQMHHIFPELADVKVTHSWAGLMAFTFDFLPKIGTHNDWHYAIACNGGSGIVLMSWLGRKAAQKILGTANAPSALDGLPFKSHALYKGIPWFVPLVGSYYRLRDWFDMHSERSP